MTRFSERTTAVAIDVPRPITRNAWCLALIACSILLVFASFTAIGLYFRALDAEVQLGQCRNEVRR